jgi:hypothetical protein
MRFSIEAITRAVAGALRSTLVPTRRRILRSTAFTGSATIDDGQPASRCAYPIAAARRLIVETLRPASAR